MEATLAKFAVASLVSVAVGFSAPCSPHPSTHHGKGITFAYVAVVYTAATPHLLLLQSCTNSRGSSALLVNL